MNKEKKVIDFYLLCNKLKNIIRTGWLDWQVKRERLESIAEHVYGVQMLALAIYSEYKYDLDIEKVIFMLAIHEVGEAVIGDLTEFDNTAADKTKIEHEAVHKIFSDILGSEEIEKIFLEFDEHETPESKFAYLCDKFECAIQCKIYDEEKCVDVNNIDENCQAAKNGEVKKMLDEKKTWSELWIEYGLEHYPYDEHFIALAKYIEDNDIL